MLIKTEYLRKSPAADCMRNAVKILLLTVMGQAGLRPAEDIKIDVEFKDGKTYYQAIVPKLEPYITANAILIALDDQFEKMSWFAGIRIYVADVNQLADGTINLSLALEPPDGKG